MQSLSKQINIPELLSPAGDMESLISAVQCGADAVYMGGTAYNARNSARNFTLAELEKAIDYCHERNVKAYIALNTLLHQNEIADAVKCAVEYWNIGADALIIQDIGLLDALKDTDIELHASTQMCLHNAYGVGFALQNNIKRIVLSREASLDDILDIKKHYDCKLEVFVHGALCVGFSGQCLFSSMTGGRSGNRGTCAQICRLPFTSAMDGNKIDDGYLLSAKDICTVSFLRDIVLTGVDSLKIEGRLKRPEYVGVVTRQYRLALDAIAGNSYFDNEYAVNELQKAFNRGGFTKGYFYNSNDIIYKARPNNCGVKVGRILSDDGRNAVFNNKICAGDGVELRKNGKDFGGGAIYDISQNGCKVKQATGNAVINSLAANCKNADIYKTTDYSQAEWLKNHLHNENITIPLSFTLTQDNYRISLSVTDGLSSVEETCEYLFAEGNTSDSDIKASLSKLGGTVYFCNDISINRYRSGYIPIRVLNGLRRQAIQSITEIRLTRYKRNTAVNTVLPCYDAVNKTEKMCTVYSVSGFEQACSENWDTVVFKPYDYACLKNIVLPSTNAKLYFAPFEIAFKNDIELLNKLSADIKKFDGIFADNLYAVMYAKQMGMSCIGGEGLNVTNAFAAHLLRSNGVEKIFASYEASADDITAISKVLHCVVTVKGCIPLMKLVHCPRKRALSGKYTNPCQYCNGDFTLTDRKGFVFGVKRFCQSTCKHIIYNCRLLDIDDKVPDTVSRHYDFNYTDMQKTCGHYPNGVK